MSSTQTTSLTEFLLARIAEDEALARDASDDGHRWLLEEETISLWPDDREPADGFMSFPRKAHASLACEWNPDRVLAECEAKRRIAEFERDRKVSAAVSQYGLGVWRAFEEVVRVLALPYADHPDYLPEWKP